jgi:hypothetical protein
VEAEDLNNSCSEDNWETHDFAVKMLDWSAARGSKLAHTCRRCGRSFCHFAAESRRIWAVDGEGRALEGNVSDRWLLEQCPRLFSMKDEEDRKRVSKAIGA